MIFCNGLAAPQYLRTTLRLIGNTMEADLLNSLSDIVVPIYTILAIVLVVAYSKRKVVQNPNPDRVYKLAKKGANVPAGTWQQQMTGTWEKTERLHFYEFMMFNGAPSFVASLKKDSAFGQIISFADNDKQMKIIATGTPGFEGPMAELGTCLADSKPAEGKDMGGRLFKLKTWWDEEKKELYNVYAFVVEGNEMTQVRRLLPDGRLFIRADMKKPDGRSDYFEAYLKKV